MPGNDVRSGLRIPAILRIRLKFTDEANFIERYSMNISRGGIFVATRTPKTVGTYLRFEFQLEGGETLIGGEGTVVWVKPFDPAHPERPHGMGVRFDQLDDASRSVVERALAWKERMRQATGGDDVEETEPRQAIRSVDLAAVGSPGGSPAADDTREVSAHEEQEDRDDLLLELDMEEVKTRSSNIKENADLYVSESAGESSVIKDKATADARLGELLAEAGLTDAHVAEVAARARARTTALVEKLSGDATEFDWLLDPPRPETLPTPAQARALLSKLLSTRS